jgi:hypothetical protein
VQFQLIMGRDWVQKGLASLAVLWLGWDLIL